MNAASVGGRDSVPASNPTEPLAHTIKQSCELLSISRSHFYELMAAGRIRTITLGNRRLVPRAEINRLIEAS